MKKLLFVFLFISSTKLFSQEQTQNKFAQLEQLLPTPNSYRSASGAPGPDYWQQRADYKINVELNDENQSIAGEETITYFNNSPDVLSYLWLQLDQNISDKNSDTYKIKTGKLGDSLTFDAIKNLEPWFDGGFKIDFVKDAKGADLSKTINRTMMRVDLPQKLNPKETFTFKIKWSYNINDRMKLGGRSGYEYFEDDKNYLYTIAQFFPRMCVYSDVIGWNHKQFLGAGEFALTFGNYEVNIIVPADHVVASTGSLQNTSAVLSAEQQARLEKSKNANVPVLIITQKEAEEAEKVQLKGKKTWKFKAENVRDFAFASSRKFMWDAQGVKFGNRTVLAMSYFPKEGNPLWEQYSTRAVVQTLKTYSKHTFDYPYPVAISVNAKDIGMEYPMICFNFGRPEKDGTYSSSLKYGVLGVVIHEVGHNYFPMIINSDERQWTWMDEGLNSFLQYLTEQEFDRDFPSRRGPVAKITDYMKGSKSGLVPIMTNSESILQFGNNAYGKPAAGLNILRETILGRELFDFSFKTYAQRWMFKHPSPADFFRTMEDASGTDLDWFWRGWFYTIENTDLSIDKVTWKQLSTGNPATEKPILKSNNDSMTQSVSEIKNKTEIPKTATELDEGAKDFYNSYDPFKVTEVDNKIYLRYKESITPEQENLLKQNKYYYEITFSNKGGLVMPIILKFDFEDETNQIIRIPAEIWKMGDSTITKVFVLEKKATQITLDPFLETADVDLNNNNWPAKVEQTRFKAFKEIKYPNTENPMQKERKQ
jgi:Peptidase family M1 domain